ncbi:MULTISPECIES: oxidoreductase [Azotobacter]|uniref:oxidoreductase n=1 Tax=Azotobacter TaxID=352 RepID=UPI0000526D95|nr:oxidoreductase [Azotobacter vinelandii]WKN20042.1 oxidoreductase [Azotobacter vinelandii]GLK58979.1 short-chain dehydrogenase/reductase [Azotobacter vinelandii]SFX51699.1 Short-chain dehydrogenase [Azotobacter vinelandii]
MTTKKKPVVLITGASSGMGKDFALRLLSAGYAVYGAARRIDRMRDIEGGGGVALEVDVTEDATMTAAVDRIIREQGQIDVLINCAGYGQMGALEDVPVEVARRQLEVNLIGVARLTQLCLPHMRARQFGKIINISSIGGKCAFPLAGWYHASKFALEGYSDSLRMEVRPFGVDVIVIEPGGTDSEWFPVAMAELEKHSKDGAYSRLVEAMQKSPSMKRKMPPPGVITDLVVKALNAKAPRPRYHGASGSGVILFLRHILSDRMYDRLVMSQFR